MTVLAVVNAGPPTTLLYALSILGTSGFVAVLWQMYLRWRRGPKEDDELVSRISSQVASGAHELLEEYRIELEVSKRQINLYLEQVTELNRLLGQANERIARLERALDERQNDRRDLTRQLKEAIRRREDLIQEMRLLRGRVEELERELRVPESERHQLPHIDGLDG